MRHVRATVRHQGIWHRIFRSLSYNTVVPIFGDLSAALDCLVYSSMLATIVLQER